ncbi:MAG TPA: hypothetical protein VHK67_03565 [Rhabdochlamydiaceae bacterium]|jgi:hypothetical protein|nr:hypothetical protein [Rhabdochlamydiaceae bacterium]
MSLEGISEARESAGIPPPDFTNLTTEWNGKGVQVLRTDQGVWLARRIPADSKGVELNLSERITSVNPKAPSTVEQVLDRYNLKFAPRVLSQRAVVVLESTKDIWILLPLQPSEADSLQGKVTEVDALDYEVIRKLLENQGLLSLPNGDPYFAMTQWA